MSERELTIGEHHIIVGNDAGVRVTREGVLMTDLEIALADRLAKAEGVLEPLVTYCSFELKESGQRNREPWKSLLDRAQQYLDEVNR